MFPFRAGFLYLSNLGWKLQGSICGNIRKPFFWKNIRVCFNIRARNFHSRRDFFRGGFFWSLLAWPGKCTRKPENILLLPSIILGNTLDEAHFTVKFGWISKCFCCQHLVTISSQNLLKMVSNFTRLIMWLTTIN